MSILILRFISKLMVFMDRGELLSVERELQHMLDNSVSLRCSIDNRVFTKTNER